MNASLLYQIPIWAGAIVFAAILLLSSEAGYRFGLRWRHKRGIPKKGKKGGDVIVSGLLGLLGLMLAFTYSFVLRRADDRKDALYSETNAIGTAFLQADMVEEPGRTVVRMTLYEYAKGRIVQRQFAEYGKEAIGAPDVHSALPVEILWPAMRVVLARGSVTPAEATLTGSMNHVLDMNTVRVAVSADRLPGIVLYIILALASGGIGVAAFNVSSRAIRRPRWHLVALALGIALVMTTITDFDRPLEGFIQIDQAPMIEQVESMGADFATPWRGARRPSHPKRAGFFLQMNLR